MNAEREAYVSDLKIKISWLHQYLDSKFNELVTAYDNDTMDDNNAVQWNIDLLTRQATASQDIIKEAGYLSSVMKEDNASNLVNKLAHTGRLIKQFNLQKVQQEMQEELPLEVEIPDFDLVKSNNHLDEEVMRDDLTERLMMDEEECDLLRDEEVSELAYN